jgi:ABC-type lipoprotein release transport system permease subunit
MAGTRLITTLLYGFSPDYLPVIAAVTGVLLFVAVIACFVPARRASRIDPLSALLHE